MAIDLKDVPSTQTIPTVCLMFISSQALSLLTVCLGLVLFNLCLVFGYNIKLHMGSTQRLEWIYSTRTDLKLGH